MAHGGARIGAGRPKKERSKVVRIPVSKLAEVKALLEHGETTTVPLFSCAVRAGFPSPADDYIEDKLDLNQFLIPHPASTFLVRAEGESMTGAGIRSGDLLIVDRSLEPTHNKIVIAAIDGELTVKRLLSRHGTLQLLSENPAYPCIEVTEGMDMVIWGVVTHVISALS